MASLRDSFPGYYRPTIAEFEALWQDSLFVFDANILLNIYKYGDETRKRFFEVLELIKYRIRIPHQIAYEFFKNRVTVINGQKKAAEQLSAEIEKRMSELLGQINRYKYHSSIDLGHLKEILSRAKSEAVDLLHKSPDPLPTILDEDYILEKLDTLFRGRIGEPYSNVVLEEKHKEAEIRYGAKVPPGYKDQNKANSDEDPYGDVTIWFQIMDIAKADSLP